MTPFLCVCLSVLVVLTAHQAAADCTSDPGYICLVSQVGGDPSYSDYLFYMVQGATSCKDLDLNTIQHGNPFQLLLNEQYHVDDCANALPKAHSAAKEHASPMFIKEKQSNWFKAKLSDVDAFIDGIKKSVTSADIKIPEFLSKALDTGCTTSSGHVFVVSPKDSDYYLIQGAADLNSLALDTLQLGNPLELNIVRDFSVHDCSAAQEKAFNATFNHAANVALDGEKTNWYETVNGDRLLSAIQQAVGNQDRNRSEL